MKIPNCMIKKSVLSILLVGTLCQVSSAWASLADLADIKTNTGNTATNTNSLIAGYGPGMIGFITPFLPESAQNNQSIALGLSSVNVPLKTASNTQNLLSQFSSTPKNLMSYRQRFAMCIPGGKLWSTSGRDVQPSTLYTALKSACSGISILPSTASKNDVNQSSSSNVIQFTQYPMNGALNFNNFIGQLGYKLNPAPVKKRSILGGTFSLPPVIDNNPADNVAPAFDFIRFISGALTPLTLPNFLTQSPTNLDVAKKQMTDLKKNRQQLTYLLNLRSYLAQLSIGVGNFTQMATERQKTIANSQKVTYKTSYLAKPVTVTHQIIPNAGKTVSPAQIEQYSMTHRLKGQQWLQNVQNSMSTISLQRQLVIMQALELNELYRIHKTLERIDAAVSASQLSQLGMDRQNLAQQVNNKGQVQKRPGSAS